MGVDKDTGSDPPSESNRNASRYLPGNTREDGSYRVGRGRTPEHTRFRQNDGRKRGRRPKGQRNFDTEFDEEARRLMTVREGGKDRRVSKMRGAIIRVFDSATAKADPRSASLVFNHASRLADKQTPGTSRLAADDDEELNAWLRERLALIETTEPGEVPAAQPSSPARSEEQGAGDDE